jgi:hypothetical protein
MHHAEWSFCNTGPAALILHISDAPGS